MTVATLRARSTKWRDQLTTDSRGNPKGSIGNVAIALRNDHQIELAWNDWTGRVEVLSAPPWEAQRWDGPRVFQESDVIGCLEHLERQHGIAGGPQHLGRVVEYIARERVVDPMGQWLNGLAWDGVPRVDAWLPRYLGTEDSAVSRAVGRCWLIQAIARACDPGCQADYVLVIEGRQGKRKSSALRALVGDGWFSDALPDIRTKDASLALQGIWIFEIAELDSIQGASDAALKAFVTRRHERFRAPYAATLQDWPRRCVFAATTNERYYLRDGTGGRRWWPVEATSIDVDGLAADREQIWAEAHHLYRSGARAWIDDRDGPVFEALQEAQEDRRGLSRWEETIAAYLDAREPGEAVEAEDLYQRLEIPMDRSDRSVSIQLGQIVTSLGWVGVQRRIRGARRRVYVRAEESGR